jgi:hypothetical protein
MAHEIAKLLLEHAGSFLERTEAVKVAMGMGMPLAEIEEYLDWIDATRGPIPRPPPGPSKDDSKDDPSDPVCENIRVEAAPMTTVPTAQVPSPSTSG